MKYGDLTLGRIEAIVNKLGGMDGVKRLLSGELIVVEKTNVRFKVWKTIKLGTIKLSTSIEDPLFDFRQTLKKNRVFANDYVNAVFNTPAFKKSVALNETEVKLTVVSIRELGFDGGVPLREACYYAQAFGLRLCPAEVGPQLALQHKNQPADEHLIIGMEPILIGSDKVVFYLRRDENFKCNALKLITNGLNAACVPQDRLVFLAPSV